MTTPAVDPRQPGQRWITTRQATHIINAYQNGATITELAKHSGWAYDTIRRLLDKTGTPRRYQATTPLPADLRQDIIRRYQDGTTVRNLATATGRAYGTIYAALRQAGVVPMRPHGPRRAS